MKIFHYIVVVHKKKTIITIELSVSAIGIIGNIFQTQYHHDIQVQFRTKYKKTTPKINNMPPFLPTKHAVQTVIIKSVTDAQWSRIHTISQIEAKHIFSK